MIKHMWWLWGKNSNSFTLRLFSLSMKYFKTFDTVTRTVELKGKITTQIPDVRRPVYLPVCLTTYCPLTRAFRDMTRQLHNRRYILSFFETVINCEITVCTRDLSHSVWHTFLKTVNLELHQWHTKISKKGT